MDPVGTRALAAGAALDEDATGAGAVATIPPLPSLAFPVHGAREGPAAGSASLRSSLSIVSLIAGIGVPKFLEPL